MGQQIISLFSKVVCQNTIDFNLDKIVSKVNEFEFRKAVDRKDSTEASIDKNVLEHLEFKSLKEELIKYVYDYTHNILKYTYNDFYISGSWLTKSIKGEYSSLHNHNNCLFSGVLYLQTDEKTGGMIFEKMGEDRLQLKASEYNLLNSSSHSFLPKAGLLIMFPSEMYHKILENNSDLTRISLAFNVFPRGEIGIETSDSFLCLV